MVDKNELAKAYVAKVYRKGYCASERDILFDFLAGYEASEKNAEQERIKYALEVLEELHLKTLAKRIFIADDDAIKDSLKKGILEGINHTVIDIMKLESQLKTLQNDR